MHNTPQMHFSVLDKLDRIHEQEFETAYIQFMLLDLSHKKNQDIRRHANKTVIFFRKALELITLMLISVHTFFIIVMSLFTNRNIAHYVILKDSIRNNEIDFRSKEMRYLLDEEKCLNFFHSSSLLFLFNIFKLPFYSILFKSILPSSYIKLFYNPSVSKSDQAVIRWYSFLGKLDLFALKILLNILSLSIFIFLDDPRYTAILRKACVKKNIPTFGYMHGRFNEFHVGLFEAPFSFYYVWSSYFKDKYLNLSSNRSLTNFYIGAELYPKNEKCFGEKDHVKLLFIDDDLTPLEKLLPYMSVLTRMDSVMVYFRSKNHLEAQIPGVRSCNEGLFAESLQNNGIDLVVGGISTCLIEASAWNCLPLSIQFDQDYGKHLIADKLCIPIFNLAGLVEFIEQLNAENFNINLRRIQSLHETNELTSLQMAWKEVKYELCIK